MCKPVFAFLLASFLGLSIAPARAQDLSALTSGDWKFRAQLYGWFPSVSASSSFPASTGGGSINLDAEDYIDNLRFVFFGTFEAQKGQLGVLTDYIYLDFDAEKGATRNLTIGGPLGIVSIPADASADVNLRLRGWAWTLAATYAAVEDPNYSLQTVAGLRYLKVNHTIDWRLSGNIGSLPAFAASGSSTDKPDVWDAILGARGRVNFGTGQWFAPYYFDIGAGQSDLTWQAMVGVGYTFGWGEAVAAYRHLSYDFGSGHATKDLSFSGPGLAVAFRW